ncbi:MAG: tetratricopeptide repeat protein [Gammaproteobacteria bacterium]|nr:tetratricopeptide repeat protein [Gammaproteobacteria bacterium]
MRQHLGKFVVFLLCICYTTFCVAQIPAQPQPESSKDVIKLPYNTKIYELAYNTFLASKKLNDALNVALAAVQHNPDNFMWRQRLATVATWTQKPDIAFEQWFYLARKSKSPDAIKNAINLGQALYEYEPLAELYLMKIRQNSADQKAWIGYITAEEARGQPEFAIDFLKSENKKQPNVFYLKELARLYQNTGQPAAELMALRKVEQQTGQTTAIASRIAELYYAKGDLKQAYQELLGASNLAKADNNQFWQTFAYLAWSTQDTKQAKRAYHTLLKANNYTNSDLLNLVRLEVTDNPKQALQLANKGWQKFKSHDFLVTVLQLAPSQKQWQLLQNIFQTIPHDQQQQLADKPYYLNAQTSLWLHQGKLAKVLATYNKALRDHPSNARLKVNYLWVLIDNNLEKPLTKVLSLWATQLASTPELLPPYTAGYALLGKTKIALILYRQQFLAKKNDYDWLVNYADEFDSADYPHMATRLRLYTWSHIANTNFDKGTLDAKLTYIRLASMYAQGDVVLRAFARINTSLKDSRVNEQLMSWALGQGNYALTEYVWHYQPASFKVPVWVQQTVALHNNDRDQLQKLLDHHRHKLPHRDRVLAAERISDDRLAQTLAYKGMQQHPRDSRMYQIMERVFLKSANNVATGLRLRRVGYLGGPEWHSSAKLFATPRIYVAPTFNLWRVYSFDKDQLLTPVTYLRNTGLKIGRIYREGEASITVGQTKAMKTYYHAAASISYRWNRKVTTTLMAGINQPTTESAPLLLAGKEHLIKFMLDYLHTERDSLHLEIAQHFFYTLYDQYLGNGQTVNLYLRHKLALAYPDWHVDVFGAWRNYSAKDELVTGEAGRVVPGTQTSNADFFMLDNALEYGAAFGYGENLLDEYTHSWRTFGQLGLFHNLDTGLGSLLTFGVAGTVFGRDHLAFYLTGSDNFNDLKQLEYMIGMTYKLYF